MFTYGTDPEVFVRHKTGRQRIISAHDMVPGTKNKPHQLKCGGGLQADGTAVEFNIPPARNGKEFATLLEEARREIVKEYLPKDCHLDYKPYRRYSETYWDKLPTLAKEIGCEPEEAIPSRFVARQPRERYRGTGFHIHIGWTKNKCTKTDIGHKYDALRIVGYLDRLLKPFRDVYDHGWYNRFLNTGYGRPGCYRIKPYGVEYRTMSGFMMAYGPKYWESLITTLDSYLKLAVEEQTTARYLPFDINKRLRQKAEHLKVAPFTKDALDAAKRKLVNYG